MAKKTITDMTVEEKLKALYQLQTYLSGIDEKRALRGELPLEVQDLEDELAGLNTRLDNIKGEIADFKAAITQKKGEIANAQTSVERYTKQLDSVKNNREYETLSKEIEFQNLEVELCNKKINEAEARIRDKQQETESVNALIADREAALDEKRSELDGIMQETRDDEEKLKNKARDLEEKIDPGLLRSFKRIRKGARNGLAISVVQRDSCGGCNNKIPPQRQLDVKMHQKIVVCEYCGRILIDPDLAGIKTEKKVDEKPKRKRSVRRTAKKAEAESEPTEE